jgi:hypothetical protein
MSYLICATCVYYIDNWTEVPSAPFLDLTVLSSSAIQANFSAPLSDGGAAVDSYQLQWDTNPGVQEVQTVTTGVYVGPNQIQSITTSAVPVDEVQTIKLFATPVREVQVIHVSQATGGYFFLQLDTSSYGGSLQYSGYINVNYPAAPSATTYGRDVQGKHPQEEKKTSAE